MFKMKTEDTFKKASFLLLQLHLFQWQQFSTFADVSYYYVIFYIYFIDAYAMGWTIQSLDPCRDKRSSLLQNVADQHWGPPSITFYGYCCCCCFFFFFFCRDRSRWDMNFTADSHLKPRLRMSGSVLLRPSVCPYGKDMNRFAFMFCISLVWLTLLFY